MPRIFDNIEEQLATGLSESLSDAVALDACVGYLNLRGWDQLAESVDALPGGEDRPPVRLLVGMTADPNRELRDLLRIDGPDLIDNARAAALQKMMLQQLREQLTYGIPTKTQERALQTLRGQLADGTVQVKLYLSHRLHAKLYLCHKASFDNPVTGYIGSSNLTFAGLVHQGELNVDVLDQDATQKLYAWFEDRWTDQFSIDITEALVEILDESWASLEQLDPYLIYIKLAYHLSREARDGFLEYGLPESMSTLR